VQRNPEGRENQRELAQRALALGWSPQRVRVIDADLGLSGQSTEGREGFRELTSEVSLGHAGIVLAYEASRLARNNADWYALLDLCTLRGTLIADADGIYDPTDYNDRLLLGLRGMMSEAELHLIRQRMDAGKLRQIEKGTYRQGCPPGSSGWTTDGWSSTRTNTSRGQSSSSSSVLPRWGPSRRFWEASSRTGPPCHAFATAARTTESCSG
jgi:DNA invertase Pin-like site-specific DNA recombinase